MARQAGPETRPGPLAAWTAPFAGCSTRPTRANLLVLAAGAVPSPGRRTAAAALGSAGLRGAATFANHHRAPNRSRWPGQAAARRLLGLPVAAFVPGGPVVVGVEPRGLPDIDETIGRRRGTKIKARGIRRDPVRSSHGHFVKASGLRWISPMPLAPVPFAGLGIAVPGGAGSFRASRPSPGPPAQAADGPRTAVAAPARAPAAEQKDHGRRRQQLRRNRAARSRVPPCGRDHSEFRRNCARLRLDARLFDPPPPRLPGTRGRPRVSGVRQPTLLQRLAGPKTAWQRATATATGWRGQGERRPDVVSGRALRHHPGKQAPVRRVLVRDRAGEFEPQAFLCTDHAADPAAIPQPFVRRWSVEAAFAEVRRHLGVETQRRREAVRPEGRKREGACEGSGLAIARTTPCLPALFSLVTLRASDLAARGLVQPRRAAWHAKRAVTSSDALAAVRRQLWIAQAFSTSPHAQNAATIPRMLRDSLAEAAGCPA